MITSNFFNKFISVDLASVFPTKYSCKNAFFRYLLMNPINWLKNYIFLLLSFTFIHFTTLFYNVWVSAECWCWDRSLIFYKEHFILMNWYRFVNLLLQKFERDQSEFIFDYFWILMWWFLFTFFILFVKNVEIIRFLLYSNLLLIFLFT